PQPTQPQANRRLDRTASANQQSTRTAPPAAQPVRTTEANAEPLRQTTPASSVTVPLPGLDQSATSSASPPAPVAAALADPPAPGELAPSQRLPLLPWLLAAVALGVGGVF